MKHSILCVDDEVDNVDALERLFRRKYRVLKATSGAEGLELLRTTKVSLIISDQRMPHMTGVEFLSQSTDLQPEAMRILLTGYTDIDSVISAINSGQVYRYLTKPWDPVDLANTVDQAIDKFELTRELREKNAALEKAYSELKTLDEAKNQFMILINHELKTPLTVMMSFLQLLEDSKLDEEQQMFLSRISKASDKLKRMIDDALELISAETGVLKTNFKTLSTEDLLSGIQEPFANAAQQKQQKIVVKGDKAKVHADQKIIRSVLSRLIDNAVKFADDNSTISVMARKKKATMRISVTNQGSSLSPEIIDKILKPFTLDEDVMNHSKGTGLGLSLSQAYLKTHDSTLDLKSQDNQVEVAFELPIM